MIHPRPAESEDEYRQNAANRLGELVIHETTETSGAVSRVDAYWPAGADEVPISNESMLWLLEKIYGDVLVWHGRRA